jgi:RNA polymerase sigma factor (sigma-70 family)
MKITAVTKFRYSVIHQALRDARWSQSELSRRTGITASMIGMFANIKRRPNEEHAKKIEAAFISVGILVDILGDWPSEFKGIKNTFAIEQTSDLQPKAIEAFYEQRLLENGEDSKILEDRIDFVKSNLDVLTPKEKQAIELKLNDGLTNMEIATIMNCSSANVGYLIQRAISKLQWETPLLEKEALGMKITTKSPFVLGLHPYAPRKPRPEQNFRMLVDCLPHKLFMLMLSKRKDKLWSRTELANGIGITWEKVKSPLNTLKRITNSGYKSNDNFRNDGDHCVRVEYFQLTHRKFKCRGGYCEILNSTLPKKIEPDEISGPVD